MARKATSKLYRNLKLGDKFVVSTDLSCPRQYRAVVTVTAVQETSRAWFTGRRQWVVHGNYPWWWTLPIRAYSDDRTDLVVE